MQSKFCSGLMVLMGLTLLLPNAFAQNKSRFRKGSEVRATTHDGNIVREDGKNVLYKKKNLVDFDDSLIEGEVKNPGEFYFVHRPEQNFGSLVKKRKNFHKEMLRDTVMIR
jgi:hypothetical protein